jgi:hypothetical protein
MSNHKSVRVEAGSLPGFSPFQPKKCALARFYLANSVRSPIIGDFCVGFVAEIHKSDRLLVMIRMRYYGKKRSPVH